MNDCKDIEEVLSIQEILDRVIKINNDNDIEETSKELIKYYDNQGRHMYSEVSAFLYNISDENLEYVYINLEKIREYFLSYDKENTTEYTIKILKLEDHIRLEILRATNLQKIQRINVRKLEREIFRFSRQIKGSEEKLEGITLRYEEQKKNIEGLNSEIISIIGIFSAIVITFFGGINFIESVLNSIGKVSKYRLVFAIFMTGFVMFNTIFMLLNFIAKLTGKNIRSYCDYCIGENKCDSSCKHRNKVECIKLKHPTIYWVNAAFIIGMIVITLMYYLDYYDVITRILLFLKLYYTK